MTMFSFFSFRGKSPRLAMLQALLAGGLLIGSLEIWLDEGLYWFFGFIVAALFFSPIMTRRLRDQNLSPAYFISLLSWLLPLSIMMLLVNGFSSNLLDNFNRDERKIILLVLTLLLCLICTLLIWAFVRNHFLRLWIASIPVLGQIWLLYRLFFVKSFEAKKATEKFSLDIAYKHIYFTIKGRISRGEMWLYCLLPYALISIFCYQCYLPLLRLSDNLGGVGIAVTVMLSIILLVFSYCIFVKRLHDINKSAWWNLLIFIPVIGSLYLTIITSFYRGDSEANRYGDTPDNEGAIDIYHRVCASIERWIQHVSFTPFVIFSLILVTTVTLYNAYFLAILSYPIHQSFGALADMMWSWLNVGLLVCMAAISFMALQANNRQFSVYICLAVIAIWLLGLIVFTVKDIASILFFSQYTLMHLAAMFSIIVVVLIASRKNITSNLSILGLLIGVYGISQTLSELYRFSLRHTWTYFLAFQHLAFIQIGAFLMVADQKNRA